MPAPAYAKRLAALVFFLSGCAALTFETVWFHVASTVLGSSVHSAASVLAAFMAGLALGNAGLAWLGRHVRRPFRWYIAIELIIAITGITSIYLLPALSALASNALAAATEQPGSLTALRFGLAFAVFLLPAVAMGATLPVVQKALHHLDTSFSASIGRLYGWNTVGAVVGVLATEFLLVQTLGIRLTGWFAGGLNLAAALAVLLFLRAGPEQRFEVPAPIRGQVRLGPLWIYLSATFLAGFILLALEMVWFRYILLTQLGTSTVFAVMLAIVLAGLAIGGLLATRCNTAGPRLERWLTLLPMLSAAGVVAGYLMFQWVTLRQPALLLTSQYRFALPALGLMLPVSILSGMLFPFWGEKLYRHLNLNTAASGLLTVANTTGAALGSVVATFLLLPRLGIETSLLLLALAYFLLSALATLATRPLKRPALRWGALIALPLVLALAFPSGSLERSNRHLAQARYAGETWILTREEVNATLQYFRRDFLGQPEYFRLATDNYSMSSTDFYSRRYMELFVHIPYILHPGIRDVLLISYGVGNTAEAMVQLEGVKRFDVVDTSAEILRLSDVIHEATGIFPLRDPRTHVHVEDGRFYLQTTRRGYDLITGEPPPPKMARIANLYTREYFGLIRERLNPGGLVSYWLPTHNLHSGDTLAIIQAFCAVFEDCSLWNGSALDFILLGSRDGIQPLNTLQRDRAWQSIGDLLQRIGLEQPEQFGSLFLASGETLRDLAADHPPLTDNYPKRISPDYSDIFAFNPLYEALLEPVRRRQELLSTRHSGAWMTPQVRMEGADTLELEAMLTALRIAPMGYLQQEVPDMDRLLRVLRNTSNTTIPMIWAGLTPRHRESDTTVHRGHITKQGSRLVRWAADEAVQKQPSDSKLRAHRDHGRAEGQLGHAARQTRALGKVRSAFPGAGRI